MKTTALAATLLFVHGQTTERTVLAAERLGRALGVTVRAIGPGAPAALLTSIVTNGASAFLIVMAMTFGLILPRMLFERILPTSARRGMVVQFAAARFKISPRRRHIPYQ